MGLFLLEMIIFDLFHQLESLFYIQPSSIRVHYTTTRKEGRKKGVKEESKKDKQRKRNPNQGKN